MTVIAFPEHVFDASDTPNVHCIRCGNKIPIILSEPVKEGFEIRSFNCRTCDLIEELVVAI